MVRKMTVISVLVVLFALSFIHADETPGLKVESIRFCTAVEGRQPTGVDTVFTDSVECVYCLTKITGAADSVSISHVWYYGDEIKAKVDLPVRSGAWRTWSSKRILPVWTGKWRVLILSDDGNVLGSKSFTIATKPE